MQTTLSHTDSIEHEAGASAKQALIKLSVQGHCIRLSAPNESELLCIQRGHADRATASSVRTNTNRTHMLVYFKILARLLQSSA